MGDEAYDAKGSQLRATNGEVIDWKRRATAAEAANASYIAALQEANNRIADAEAARDAAIAENTRLTSVIKSMSVERVTASEQIQKLRAESDTYAHLSRDRQSEVTDALGVVSDLREKLTALRAAASRLVNHLLDSQTYPADYSGEFRSRVVALSRILDGEVMPDAGGPAAEQGAHEDGSLSPKSEK